MNRQRTADVVSFYDSFAPLYQHTLHSDTRRQEVAQVAAYLERHRQHRGVDAARYSVLSAGCGTGLEAIELARGGLSVVGVDISEPMLEAARANAHDAAVAVDFRRGNLLELERVVAREFDAAICLGNVLGYLLSDDELRVVLRNIRRAVNAGGLFVADTMNYALLENREGRTQAFSFTNQAGEVVSGQYVFEPCGDFVTCTPRIVDGAYAFKELSVRLHPISTEKMSRLLKEVGFSKVDVHFDSIESLTYDAQNSGKIIYVAFT